MLRADPELVGYIILVPYFYRPINSVGDVVSIIPFTFISLDLVQARLT